MLQEALEVFAQQLEEENGERFVLDAHIPKDGSYRLIEISDDNWKMSAPLDIFYDKKKGILMGRTSSNYRFIQELDYYSKLVEMNKPIDPKKVVHTNNYLALAVKKENIVSGKLTADILKGYYAILKNPITKYEKKAKAKKLYESVQNELGLPDVELINRIEAYVLSHNIWEGMNLEKKDYAKIFFVFPDGQKTKDYYKTEGNRYLIPNIYNSNDFNTMDQEQIVGLPNNNMGMNSKKPYLENKTRKVKVPYLLNQQEVLLQTKLFDYLMGEVSQRRINIYVDNDYDEPMIRGYTDMESPDDLENGYYLRCRKEKNEVAIIEADVITHFSTVLSPAFQLKNHIEIPDGYVAKSKLKYDKPTENLWEIKNLIDAIFFEGKLNRNFSTDAGDLNIYDGTLKRCLLESRDVLAAWFWKGEASRVEATIDKISIKLIKNSIQRGDTFWAQKQFNLRWSILEYLNENRRIGSAMRDIRQQLREHINLKKEQEWDFCDDKEFAYGVGQAVYYLLSLSKANNKNHSFINPFLDAKDVTVIKRKIMQIYKKYNYRMEYKGANRGSQLLSKIMIYEPQIIYSEYIMAGFTASSLIYEKNDDVKGEETNE